MEQGSLWSNKEVYGVIDYNIEEAVNVINQMDQAAIDGNLSGATGISMATKDFWQKIRTKESIIRQKSRARWIQEGDYNTRYFHNFMKSRQRRNYIPELVVQGKTIADVELIKEEIQKHFSCLFSEQSPNRPFLDSLCFDQLSTPQNETLIAPFTETEVRDIIFQSDGNKSPGPDGFNLNFFKATWNIIKEDIMGFFKEFHLNASLPKALTSSFLALIPKVKNPSLLKEFRPICLIGSLYKILSKVLAKRLKDYLGSLISICQTAFIPQRQILDGIVVLNEIVESAKRRKSKCLLLKLDFERAFDTVSWSFLEKMMTKMNFHITWVRWMRACLFKSTMSVLVNGSPTEEFSVEKGLRQGDPLAPFMFIIATEGLARMVRKAGELGILKGFNISQELSYSLLQFADDTMMICQGRWEDLWSIKAIIRGFELVSGLRVNFSKSFLIPFNLEDSFIQAASSFLSCPIGKLPIKFLGLPVGANPRRISTWSPVLDALSSRLSSWKSKYISIGGRITLIKSVLASIPLYFFYLFSSSQRV